MLWKKYNKCVEKLLELWKTYSHLNVSGGRYLTGHSITLAPKMSIPPRSQIPTIPPHKSTDP